MKNENQPLLLDTLHEIDIRTVDQKDFVDINDVTIREELPLPERVRDYIQQIKNPYCYLSHGTVVKIRFTGSRTLEECINSCISMEA